MRLVRLTNRLNTSLTIEDMGVRLEPGGFVDVDPALYRKSVNIKSLRDWLRIDEIQSSIPPKHSEPPPKMSGRSRTEKRESDVPPSTRAPATVVVQQDPSMREHMARMETLLGTLVEHVRSGQGPAMIGGVVMVPGQASLKPQALPVIAEPMFIPSSIVPEVNTDNVRVSEEQVEGNTNDAVAALRKLRK